MSYDKLEVVANSLRPLLPRSGGAKSPRVDAWRVFEQVLPKAGLNGHVMDVEELDDCAGFTIPENGLVVLRRDVYDGLFREDVFSRSTVIHELAHVVLKHSVTWHRGATLGQHRFFEDSEWQAKALTAAVMMPIEACDSAGSPAELAHLCGTSVEAATYRLERLTKQGLISQRPRGLF